MIEGDYDDLVVPDGGHPKLSPTTMVHYYQLFRDIIADYMINSCQGYTVGGPGTTIEIDESMFGECLH